MIVFYSLFLIFICQRAINGGIICNGSLEEECREKIKKQRKRKKGREIKYLMPREKRDESKGREKTQLKNCGFVCYMR